MSSSDRISSRRSWLLAAAAAATLAGCGFHLRQPPKMPFRTIALRGFDPRSPLAAELKRALQTVAEVVPDAQAQVVVEALADQRESSVVAVTADAQVRELQQRVRFRFRVLGPDGRELLPPDELLQARDMSYNETNALAKEQEAEQLYRAMQSDIVAQVMRRLSAVNP